MFCEKCGTKLEPDDRFCMNCGEPVKNMAESALETPYVANPYEEIAYGEAPAYAVDNKEMFYDERTVTVYGEKPEYVVPEVKPAYEEENPLYAAPEVKPVYQEEAHSYAMSELEPMNKGADPVYTVTGVKTADEEEKPIAGPLKNNIIPDTSKTAENIVAKRMYFKKPSEDDM